MFNAKKKIGANLMLWKHVHFPKVSFQIKKKTRTRLQKTANPTHDSFRVLTSKGVDFLLYNQDSRMTTNMNLN